MNVGGDELLAQYHRAVALWAWLADVERAHGLAPYLLFALGSRESGLEPEYAEGKVHDDGHGWGLFGADDAWNDLPAGFGSDPHAQAELAASTLEANRRVAIDWVGAINAYGPLWARGRQPGDYGPDVLSRAEYLAAHVSDVDDDPPAELDPLARGHGQVEP